MRGEVLGKCPVCGEDTIVTEIECTRCETKIQGKFSLCKFNKLTKEEKEFIEIFIKNRGNIKEIEKELKISYPTVRNKLEDVIKALGYKTKLKSVDSKAILERLNNGEITKDDALRLLKDE